MLPVSDTLVYLCAVWICFSKLRSLLLLLSLLLYTSVSSSHLPGVGISRSMEQDSLAESAIERDSKCKHAFIRVFLNQYFRQCTG